MSARAAAADAEPDRAELRKRHKSTADVLTLCQEVSELEDGYALRYPQTAVWSEKLASFADSWRVSCPQMTFEVVAEDSSLWLRIRGPEGTKQFVDGARYMLTSHINPTPSLKMKLRLGLRFVTGPLRVLPDFLVIGAKKCGTTALYAYLTQHPSIAPAFKKEIYFFNAFYGKGRYWYQGFFPTVFERRRAHSAGRAFLTGEATPDYLFNPHAPTRTFATVPEARLIAILRNPVDRAYSFYHHNLRAGVEHLSFEDAVDREQERLAGEREKVLADPDYFSFDHEHHSYLARGVYVDQVKDWTERFSRSQVLVLATEALYDRPKETLREAFSFLGLPYHAPGEFRTLNAAAPYPDMDPRTRQELGEYFEPHNRRLYEFLDKDLGW
ncbi:MAG: sulfotransferase domain-containing protein [Planctomycetota bacterium]|nr:sulfotransferase domain-containing protein [Planctomycetota bacterium]